MQASGEKQKKETRTFDLHLKKNLYTYTYKNSETQSTKNSSHQPTSQPHLANQLTRNQTRPNKTLPQPASKPNLANQLTRNQTKPNKTLPHPTLPLNPGNHTFFLCRLALRFHMALLAMDDFIKYCTR